MPQTYTLFCLHIPLFVHNPADKSSQQDRQSEIYKSIQSEPFILVKM